MKLIKLSLFLLFTVTVASAQSMPLIKTKALDNSEVTLPDAGGQRILILVVGFSHKSGEICQAWDKKISAEYRADAPVAYFVLPVLQSAPSLVRPMILHGMRKDVPTAEFPHYIPVYSNESEWKKLVNFSAPDDAYLIVATPDGRPVWQGHGSYSDDFYAELKKSVAALLEKPSASSPKNAP
jgi:hypothetical protein